MIADDRRRDPAIELVVLDEVDSTSSEAARRLDAGESGEFAVMAVRQTAGRGRQGRSWVSPAGNLHLSVALLPELDASRSGELAFVAAVAVRRAIAQWHPRGTLWLKWPNDILIDGAKLCGILVENRIDDARVSASIIGIGVNVASSPAGMAYPVVSLAECGVDADVHALATAILRQLEAVRILWSARGFDPVASEWTGAAWRHDLPVTVDDGAGRTTGIFVGLSDRGALRLRTDRGVSEISSGSLSYETAA